MRKKPKLDLGLTAYEELFMDKDELRESRLPKVFDIPIELIDDFPDHPFKVRMDEDMQQLIDSIREQGLITPVILRPKEDGRYEMVSGHRRKEACIMAGYTMIKAEVREITHEEATVLMVDSNLQRTVIRPSEKAFSYKMRLEALKRQGKRTDLTSCPVGTRSNQQVGEDIGDSARQVARYVRLTELVPELLNLVDENKIALRPAVELSYLSREEQEMVYEQVMRCDCTPSHAQTRRFRQFSKDKMLSDSVIESIMREEKPNQKEKLHIPYDQIKDFLPPGQSYEQTCCYIKQALEFYREHNKTA